MVQQKLAPIILLMFMAIMPCCYFSSVDAAMLNNPHAQLANHNVFYSYYSSAPKTLDPARAYEEGEIQFIAQIYESPLQYNYFHRPYLLEPLTAAHMPVVSYLDKNFHKLPDSIEKKQIAYTLYDIDIKPGIFYQPHPAFIKHSFDLRGIYALSSFKQTGTRELIAQDYVEEIKRLADPTVRSPIFGLMSRYILGFAEYQQQLAYLYQQQRAAIRAHHANSLYIDLRRYPLAGAKVVSRYHYQIIIRGYYPQFLYWLSMTFFSPMPWEAIYFYSQPNMEAHNLTLDWHPVGTGPYQLVTSLPQREFILQRNRNFHGETYPKQEASQDNSAMPFIDYFVFTLEKESIPRWNKFLQGYYDTSTIHPDSFDQAIRLDTQGKPMVAPALEKKGIQLRTAVIPGIYFIGFNMLDDIVGGYTLKKQKLRQAISIALDYEELVTIFMNGRGKVAQGPIPPGVFGYQSGEVGINPIVYDWVEGRAKRKSLEQAKQLLSEAGYPGGRNPKTHKHLVLEFDTPTTGSPDENAYYTWFRKQFAKLGIELNVNATLYNRFQDKMRTGNTQLFSAGWLADYPDPENFLFLLYGPNGKVKYGGENAANYANPEVDRLFTEIAVLPDGAERQTKINQLLTLVRRDSPWIWGYFPISFTLSHSWVRANKPNPVANNNFKYQQIDFHKRNRLIEQWNQPILWPLGILLGFIVLLLLPLIISYWRRERRPTIKRLRS